jgi:hypothetical protein
MSDLNFKFKNLQEFEQKPGCVWIPATQPNITYLNGTNDFLIYLKNLYLETELHSSIINTKAKLIGGDELIAIDEPSKLFSEEINKQGDNLHDVIRKSALDLSMFGFFYWKILKSRDKATILNIEHVDATKILLGVKNEKEEIDTFFYSKNWQRYRQNLYTPITLKKYNDNKEENGILYSNYSYFPGIEYYGLPEYISCLRALEINEEILKYHLANLRNDFSPGTIITFIVDEMSDEQKQEFGRRFNDAHTTALKAGKPVKLFANSKETAPTITTQPANNLDTRFLALASDVAQRIISAHGLNSPILAGIQTPGSLGNSSELESAYKIFYENRIKNAKKFMERQLKIVTDFNNLTPIKIKTKEPKEVLEEKNNNPIV